MALHVALPVGAPAVAKTAPAGPVADSADARLKAIDNPEWPWRQKEMAGEPDEDISVEPSDHLPHVDAVSQAKRAAPVKCISIFNDEERGRIP